MCIESKASCHRWAQQFIEGIHRIDADLAANVYVDDTDVVQPECVFTEIGLVFDGCNTEGTDAWGEVFAHRKLAKSLEASFWEDMSQFEREVPEAGTWGDIKTSLSELAEDFTAASTGLAGWFSELTGQAETVEELVPSREDTPTSTIRNSPRGHRGADIHDLRRLSCHVPLSQRKRLSTREAPVDNDPSINDRAGDPKGTRGSSDDTETTATRSPKRSSSKRTTSGSGGAGRPGQNTISASSEMTATNSSMWKPRGATPKSNT